MNQWVRQGAPPWSMKKILLAVIFLFTFAPITFSASFKSFADESPKNQDKDENSNAIAAKPALLMELSDSILGLIIEFAPMAQIEFGKVSKYGKALVERSPYYQLSLGANLGLKGFEKIPMHTDLKVFEHITFPKTASGKADALTFVFLMAMSVLKNSPIYKQILGIVFDEAKFLLSRENSQTFQNFVARYGFASLLKFTPHIFFSHFIRTKDYSSLAMWLLVCQGVFKKINLSLASFKNLEESVPVVSSLFKYHLKLVEIFRDYLPDFYIFFMLCAELPAVKMYEYLINSEFSPEMFLDILSNPSFAKFTLNQSFNSRMFGLFEHTLKRKELPQISTVLETLLFFSNLRCHNYSFSELEIKDASRFDQTLMESYLAKVLFAGKRYEEAVKYLPEKPDQNFLTSIADNQEFCTILAKSTPKWIKDHFSTTETLLVYKEKSLAMAFFDVAFVDDLITCSDNSNLLPMIYSHCSFESIESMISLIISAEIKQLHFKAFHDCADSSKMHDDRYITILKIFLKFAQAENPSPVLIVDIPLSTENLFAIIEQGGEEMLEKLKKRPFDCNIFFSNSSYFEIINSTHLRAKLFKHKDLILKFFIEELDDITVNATSPLEIYYSFKFFNDDLDMYFGWILINRWINHFKTAKEYRINIWMRFMSLGRVYYGFDRSIDVYSKTEDFFKKSLDQDPGPENKLLQLFYDSYSKRGQSIIKNLFSEIARFIRSKKGQKTIREANHEFDDQTIQQLNLL